uniref:Uncharacterized protein n=1 Tax=Arundo donax TaxID=35708 RepID=A0A0A8Z6T4_ARUDO
MPACLRYVLSPPLQLQVLACDLDIWIVLELMNLWSEKGFSFVWP